MDMQVAAPEPIEAHRLTFSGTGGDYFRVWIVNILLMVVTLGLFTPFARRRTLQYFYGHTEVAGSPLEFTGGLRRMVVGFLIFLGLYIAYEIASRTEQNKVAAGLLLLFALGGPWVWASSTRFRLTSTRWRGIRGYFDARWGEVYRASWPVLGIVGAFIGIALLVGSMILFPAAGIAGVVLAMVLVLLCTVRLEYNYTRLRFERGGFGGQPARWKASFGDFVKLSAAAFGLIFLAFLVFGGVMAGIVASVAPMARGSRNFMLLGLLPLAMMVLLIVAISPVAGWREARKFVLVWNGAGLGHIARTRCDLRPWAFARLRLRNMLVTVVTLGFWRPFARVSEYRMKVESVTLHVKGGLDQLAGRLADGQQGAFADALADGIGFDMVG